MKYNNFTLSDRLGGLCENQNNLFTSGHEKHRLTVTIKDGKGNTYTRRTSYQFNPNFTKFEDGDGLRAWFSIRFATITAGIFWISVLNMATKKTEQQKGILIVVNQPLNFSARLV